VSIPSVQSVMSIITRSLPVMADSTTNPDYLIHRIQEAKRGVQEAVQHRARIEGMEAALKADINNFNERLHSAGLTSAELDDLIKEQETVVARKLEALEQKLVKEE
jgi:hypothetical protein